MFVTGYLFQPSLMFASKATTYLTEAPVHSKVGFIMMERPIRDLANINILRLKKGFITLGTGPNVIKLFLSVISGFSYQARVFVRLEQKSSPMTNTLAYCENM